MIDDVGQHSHLSHFSASFVDYQSLVIQSLVIFGKISVRPLNSVPPCGAESSFGSVGFACGYPHAVFAVRDFAQVKYDGRITKEVASFALDLLEVDRYGLDQTDRLLLTTIMEKFQGGPVGLDTLAASIGEDAGTIEEVYEPFLIKSGFINRTPRGRVATEFAWHHLGLEAPRKIEE